LSLRFFDFLVYLIRNRDHVVSKGDMIAAVSGSRIVSESALTNRITAARAAFACEGAISGLIRTSRSPAACGSGPLSQADRRAGSQAPHASLWTPLRAGGAPE
jgi:hypothetical protein